MKVQLKLFATLRQYITENDRGICTLEVKEQSSVSDVLEQLGVPTEIPKIILINGMQKQIDDRLLDGDSLSVFPPIAGG